MEADFNPITAAAICTACEELDVLCHDIEACICDNDHWEGEAPDCWDSLINTDIETWCTQVEGILWEARDYLTIDPRDARAINKIVKLAKEKVLTSSSPA